MNYSPVGGYIATIRMLLQDFIAPYRYDDPTIVDSINTALAEMARIRPDIFLDLKYKNRFKPGDTDDGYWEVPQNPTTGAPLNPHNIVPVPDKYYQPLCWYAAGWCQLFDVADTQDQRANAFLQKFNQHMLSVSAA